MENFQNVWKIPLPETSTCEGCMTTLHIFRKKRLCIFCKKLFCSLCILRRPDKKLCCRKCQILTARPLDRDALLNLKSKDLLNYLTSRHISTNGCVEKEDLVNVLMRAVNNSSFHASSSAHVDSSLCTNSYPNSPHRNAFPPEHHGKRKLTQSVEDLSSQDGIRITGANASDGEMCYNPSGVSNSESKEVVVESSNTEESCSDHVQVEESSAINLATPENSNSNEENIQSSTFTENNEATSLDDKSCSDVVYSKPLMLSDINSSADLESLSVKQLKELLTRNRTDYKGCIERTELLEKVNRLWSDYTSSRKDLEKLSLDELCKICMDAPIECVLLECGHMATCTSCGKQLCECPICRQFVVRCVRTFKA